MQPSIVLPWPDKGLFPNARLHWAPLSKLKAAAREEAAWETKATIPQAQRKTIAGGDGPIPVTVRFYPPDRRHRDDDNIVGGFKALRDGIADALGVNDRRFRPHYYFEAPAKPGRIEVSFPPHNPQIGGASQPYEANPGPVNGLPPDEQEAA